MDISNITEGREPDHRARFQPIARDRRRGRSASWSSILPATSSRPSATTARACSASTSRAAKGWSAIAIGASTRQLARRAKENPNFFVSLAATSHGKFLPQPGGVLIKNAEGQVIGACGVSGSAVEHDEECCVYGVGRRLRCDNPIDVAPRFATTTAALIMRRSIACITLGAAALLPLASSAAQNDGAADYPNQPVRLVVTFAPGASNDILARLIGSKLPKHGARTSSSTTGRARAGRSARHGFEGRRRTATRCCSPTPGRSVRHAAADEEFADYSPRDFTNIVYIGYAPLVILANPASRRGIRRSSSTTRRSNPGKITWGSSGNGTSPHIAILLFQAATGTQVTHVPYKGAAQNMTDLHRAPDRRDLHDDRFERAADQGQPRARDRRRERPQGAPASRRADARRVSESRMRKRRSGTACRVRRSFPPAIVAKLNAEVNKALQMPDVKGAARLSSASRSRAASPKDFRRAGQSEIPRIEQLLAAGALVPE